MRKEELNEIKVKTDLLCNEINAKTSASSCWMMGIFFLGLKRKAHHPREATLLAKNKNTPVGAGLVSAQNRGITLIALVITIIVLLILAGVTISLTLGENGIFKIAETSVEKQKIAEYEEKIELSKSKALGENKGTITIDDLINQIYKDGIVLEGSIKKIDEEKVSLITKEGHEFIITKTKTEYKGINEGPKINIANITPYGFTVEVKENYSDNLVQEYKYYLNEELVYSGTNSSYKIIGLNEETKYNVYVEICTEDETIKTNVVDVTTQTVVSGIKLNGNAEIITNLAQSDILKTANNEYTIAMRVKINRQEQATMNYMGLWGYHEGASGITCQFIGTGTTLGINGTNIDYTPYYDKWTDITATYNNGNAKIYFNSKLMGTVNINITPYSSFVIGNSYVEIIGNRKMKGEISSVKVWSKELTANEIVLLDMAENNTRDTIRIY